MILTTVPKYKTTVYPRPFHRIGKNIHVNFSSLAFLKKGTIFLSQLIVWCGFDDFRRVILPRRS